MLHIDESHPFPAFLIDAERHTITDSNQSFQELFSTVPKPELQELIDQICRRIDGLLSMSFQQPIPYSFGVAPATVFCQHIEEGSQEILVYLNIQYNNIPLPMHFYALASIPSIGLVMIDTANDRFLAKYANNGLLNLLGYGQEHRDAFFSQDLIQLVYKDDRQIGLGKYHSLSPDQNELCLTGRLVRRDGSLVWVNFLARVVLAPDGKKMIFALITDVSHSLQIIEKLNQEKQTVSALENYIHNIVFKYEFQYDTITFTGELFKRLTGMDSHTYTLNDFLTDDEPPFLDLRQIKRIISDAKRGRRQEYVIKAIDKDDRYYWLSVTFEFIRDAGNRNVSIVGSAEDITEQRAAKAYYDKALSLWHTKSDNCEAAFTMNISDQLVVGGYSSFIVTDELLSLSVDEYWDTILPYLLNKVDRKRLKELMTAKKLTAAFHEKKTRFTYDLEVNSRGEHRWFRLIMSLIKNPKTGDIMALVKWNDINDIKLREKIDQLLFSESFDFICLVFAKSNSYMMIMDIENSNVIPNSVLNGYETTMRQEISQYSLPEDVQYLQFCFSLKNLKTQLSFNPVYSFNGYRRYPDGSPSVKCHTFQYLDRKGQVILYTRKDITNTTETLSFKINSRTYNLAFSEILYIESFGKKSRIVTEAETFEVNEMISSIQSRLPGKKFCRCHRCYIVRNRAIKVIEQGNAMLINGSKIPVSRKKIELLRELQNDDSMI